MERVRYKKFIIDAQPEHLEGNKWSLNLYIERHTGSDVRERHFFARKTFDTEEMALAHCIDFGRQIIDGKYPNCSVSDL